MIGYLENIPDDWAEKINQHEIIINGHLDSLDFVAQNTYDWSKYFYVFPKPEIKVENFIGSYLICHLISSSSREHRMESFYITRLVKELDVFCRENKMRNLLISTPEFNQYYDEALKTTSNTSLLNAEITEVCDIISNAKLMISVDSGFRPVAYPYMPVISFSKQCFGPNQMNPSHIIRWNPIKPYFPLNWNTADVLGLTKKLLNNKVYSVFPELPEDWLKNLIRRNYKINEEKSIKNL